MDPAGEVGQGTGLAVARKLLLGALLVELAVLLVTGIVLHRSYVPNAARSWEQIYDTIQHGDRILWVRRAHRTTSMLAIPTALALVVIVAVERKVRAWVVLAACVLVDLVAAAFTGSLLPWDQLGLREITVGTDLHGYAPIFSDRVRFAIVDGAQVSSGTMRAWFVVHVVLGLLAVAGCVGLLVRRAPGAPAEPSASPAAEGDLRPGP